MKLSIRTFVIGGILLLVSWIVWLEMTSPTKPSILVPDEAPPTWNRSAWDRLNIGMPRDEVACRLGPSALKMPPLRFRGELVGRTWTILEVAVWFAAQLLCGGMEGFCCNNCERWEYDVTPDVTRFLRFGPAPEAFVVFFTDDKVVWLRRPTASPLAEGQ